MTSTPDHTGVLLLYTFPITRQDRLNPGLISYFYNMLNYLVVGLGLAGLSFCHILERHGKSFHVISNHSQKSSKVAGGLYNPVILKRFKPVWKAREQIELLRPFYSSLEALLGQKLDYPLPVLRRFSSVEEQNLWFEAADHPQLGPFLNLNLKPNRNSSIDAPFGYGEVLGTGRIDTSSLTNYYETYLSEKARLSKATFEFDKLEITEKGIRYGDYYASNIVFATGFGLSENPFFNYLPLQGSKGELLTINAPELNEKNIIKSSVFIIPSGKGLYRIGATYNHRDKTPEPTAEARKELLEKLDSFLKCKHEIVDHVAGIRPTVGDRRPLVGRHPEHKNLYVFNGLGSRGVMIAPYASDHLYRFIENDEALPSEMDISRFAKKFYKR